MGYTPAAMTLLQSFAAPTQAQAPRWDLRSYSAGEWRGMLRELLIASVEASDQ